MKSNKYRLLIELDGLPPMPNVYLRWHYQKRHREFSFWYDLINYKVRSIRPDKPLERFSIRAIRRSSVVGDFDGICGSFKPIIDSLIKAKILQDDSWNNTGQWDVSFEKVTRKEQSILVEIIED